MYNPKIENKTQRPSHFGQRNNEPLAIGRSGTRRTQQTIQQFDNGPKIEKNLFEHRDAFLHILSHLGRQDFQNLRLLCKGSRDTFENYQSTDPIGKFWEKSRLKLDLFELIKESHSNFLPRHNLMLNLSLQSNTFKKFLEFLSFPITPINKKMEFLEKLTIWRPCTTEENKVLNQMLQTISANPSLFPNLTHLSFAEFCDLSHLPVPKSIEFFESTLVAKDINICNKSLKSIKLDYLSQNATFLMENLPELESLTIDKLTRDITIDFKIFPKLKYININNKEIVFHNSGTNTLTLPGIPYCWN